MAHNPDYAKRLFRELLPGLPAKAQSVLDRASYWDPGVLELFFDFTEELIDRDPKAGLQVALIAPRYARTMPEERGPRGRRLERERLVKAFALVGSAHRAVGRFDDAEAAYRQALEARGKQGIGRQANAELCLRIATLRAVQKRRDEALKLTSRGSDLYKAAGNEQGVALAMATRGAVLAACHRFSEVVSVLTECLAKYRLPPRAEYSATHNLAYAISEADDPDLETGLKHLRQARRLLGMRSSVQKTKLYWIDGKFLIRAGKTDQGEQRFRKALKSFIDFGVPYEIALVSLDLSMLLRFARRWAELEELAADTYQRFRKLGEDLEALAALKLWLDGARARTLSEEMISGVKSTVEGRMRRRPST